jgi:hypothetical protein
MQVGNHIMHEAVVKIDPISLLKSAKIASPCPVSWESLSGDDKTRYCRQCKLEVHNVSQMSAEEIGQLLRRSGCTNQLCVRIYKRADGTILTKDCPRGLRHGKDAWLRFWQKTVAIVFALFSSVSQLRADEEQNRWYHNILSKKRTGDDQKSRFRSSPTDGHSCWWSLIAVGASRS